MLKYRADEPALYFVFQLSAFRVSDFSRRRCAGLPCPSFPQFALPGTELIPTT